MSAQPTNTYTARSENAIWMRFNRHLLQFNYELKAETSINELASILQGWALNMKKENGENYKSNVIKLFWNTTAKLLQEKYRKEFNIHFDPFRDAQFKCARDARNLKRRQVQLNPDRQKKRNEMSLTDKNKYDILNLWDEETPNGLQRKLFHALCAELEWSGEEAIEARLDYFQHELDNTGRITGRITFNPIYNKSGQDQSNLPVTDKWLNENKIHPNHCPVRLFKKYILKRTDKTSDRLFVMPNPKWKGGHLTDWYTSTPVARKVLEKWNENAFMAIGLNTKKEKYVYRQDRPKVKPVIDKNKKRLRELRPKMSDHLGQVEMIQVDVDIAAMVNTNDECDNKEMRKMPQVVEDLNKVIHWMESQVDPNPVHLLHLSEIKTYILRKFIS